MSKQSSPYWTDNQVKKLKKYLKSKKGIAHIKKMSDNDKSIVDDWTFTHEEWNKIKDVPFILN
jgi:predicted glutamine amidotransferase